jgi:hypothetical protein
MMTLKKMEKDVDIVHVEINRLMTLSHLYSDTTTRDLGSQGESEDPAKQLDPLYYI